MATDIATKCVQCGGKIPVHLNINAIHCSRTCADKAGYARRRAKTPPAAGVSLECGDCGSRFNGRPNRKWCDDCSSNASRQARYRQRATNQSLPGS